MSRILPLVLLCHFCGCDRQVESDSCAMSLEQTLSVRSAVRKLDERLSQFTIQHECAACPKPKICPDDSAALSKGDDAIRQMDEVRAIMKSYEDDSSFGFDQLISRLKELSDD